MEFLKFLSVKAFQFVRSDDQTRTPAPPSFSCCWICWLLRFLACSIIEEYCYSSWMDSCLSATRVVLICLATWPRFWIIAPNSGTTWPLVFSKRIPLMRRQHFLSSSSLLICSRTNLIEKENEVRLFLRVNKVWLALDKAMFWMKLFLRLTRSLSFRLRLPSDVRWAPTSLTGAVDTCGQSIARSVTQSIVVAEERRGSKRRVQPCFKTTLNYLIDYNLNTY